MAVGRGLPLRAHVPKRAAGRAGTALTIGIVGHYGELFGAELRSPARVGQLRVKSVVSVLIEVQREVIEPSVYCVPLERWLALGRCLGALPSSQAAAGRGQAQYFVPVAR